MNQPTGQRPLPVPTPETRHYWEGAKGGELLLQRCDACSHAYFPPRPFCPKCASRKVSVFKASGRAKLYSYVIHHRAAPGARGLARITLARPIGALYNDHFVVRDGAASRTIGGGVVLDPFPPQRGRRNPQRLELLQAWRQGDSREVLAWQMDQEGSEIDLRSPAISPRSRLNRFTRHCR